ncbi:MAG: hypothetical protein ACREBE_12225 [bacterium]
MVRDMNIALRALHEVLVAARNMGLANPSTPALLSVVDSIEAIPIWMADPLIDRAEDIIRVFEDLATEYPECGIAASTATRLRD